MARRVDGNAGLPSLAANDVPLIDNRAATRGRSATEGGDGHGSVKSGHPFERQLANAARRATRAGTRARSSMTCRPT
jgi:hypothetical protein